MSFQLVSKIHARRCLSLPGTTTLTRNLRSAGPLSVLNHEQVLERSGLRAQARFLNTKPDSDSSQLLYEGPMAKMITSLKIFSLSSAFLSSVGLPGLMLYRGLDLFSTVHMLMITTTMCGSIGSTVGLHYIFSPYVYTLERIPVRQCHSKEKLAESITEETGAESADTSSPEQSSSQNQSTTSTTREPEYLLKAKTCSVFATTVEHVFNPETDVKGPPPGTIRPFCSFIVKETTPLYIHEQMIQDPTLSQNLFITKTEPIKKEKNPDPDDEFL